MTSLPTPPRREPLFNVPLAVLLLIVAMVLVHAGRQWLTDEADFRVLADFAFVPARVTLQYDAPAVALALKTLATSGQRGLDEAQAMQFLLGQGELRPWTVLTYALLHADWTHLLLNSVWLLAFGSAVAWRFGTGRFFGFFVVTALAGAAAHWLAHPVGLAPVIGASASVSGAMAAAARFAFQPGGPMRRGGRERGPELYQLPALPLSRVFTDRQALPFVLAWFVINLVTGIGAVPLGLSESGIAWEAHIGGFLAGLVLFDWFDPHRPRR